MVRPHAAALRALAALWATACSAAPAPQSPASPSDRVRELHLVAGRVMIHTRAEGPLQPGASVRPDPDLAAATAGTVRAEVDVPASFAIRWPASAPTWIGRRVALWSGETRIEGVVRGRRAGTWSIAGQGRVHLVAHPDRVETLDDADGGAEPSWILDSEDGAQSRSTIEYEARSLTWSASSMLVVGERPRLSSWVTIHNRSARAIFADRVLVEGPGKTTDLGSLHLAAGEMRRLPVVETELSGATVSRIFDPVGSKLDRPQPQPLTRRSYGTPRGVERALETTVELGAEAAAWIEALPPGPVSVLERDRAGNLVPLGRARTFSDLAEPEGRRLRMPGSADMVGRRRRTEYHLDRARRRLVEELRVAIEHHGVGAQEVVVREHLHRGLNWTMAYFNGTGEVEKIGAQVVAFRFVVQPGERREVVYRVVYTW